MNNFVKVQSAIVNKRIEEESQKQNAESNQISDSYTEQTQGLMATEVKS